MDKQDLIAKLEQEYEAFTDRIATLSAREIIARADVIAGMHYILEYIRSEDFDITDVSADISAIDIGAEEGLLDDIHDTFRFEMNDSVHYDDLVNSLDLVLGNRLYTQQSDYRDEYVAAGDEDEYEMELCPMACCEAGLSFFAIQKGVRSTPKPGARSAPTYRQTEFDG